MKDMPMVYKIDILDALKQKGYSSTRMRNERLLPESTMTCIRQGKPISWKAIETICRLLECQPGDILIMADASEEWFCFKLMFLKPKTALNSLGIHFIVWPIKSRFYPKSRPVYADFEHKKCVNTSGDTMSPDFFMKGDNYDYRKKLWGSKKKDYFVIRSHEELVCPVCTGKLQPKGSQKRKVKFADSTKLFRFRQLFCSNCKIYHSEIPDFVAHHKQYSKNTIEDVLSGKINYYQTDDSTVNRWKKQKNV